MDNRGDFTAAIRKDVKDYFGSDAAKEIKSFASFPLASSSSVLNIHSNAPNILSDSIKRNLYQHVMTPIFSALEEIINIYVTKHGVS